MKSNIATLVKIRWLTLFMVFAARTSAQTVLVEAETFATLGGWVNDSQFMDQMGSPFLLAHGLGVPVADATTEIEFPTAGTYRVWVRTRDWVSPWGVSGAPGRFQLLLDDKPLPFVFGTEGRDWHWQAGGRVEIQSGRNTRLSLRDLTGFEGRCDALLFSADAGFEPPNTRSELQALRQRLLGLPQQPAEAGPFDLVVVGGGIAGTCASLSAARRGLSVAHKLNWAAFVSGKRESRRLLGDVVLTKKMFWKVWNLRMAAFLPVGISICTCRKSSMLKASSVREKGDILLYGTTPRLPAMRQMT